MKPIFTPTMSTVMYDSEENARKCADVAAKESKTVVYVWKVLGAGRTWFVENLPGYPPIHWQLVDAIMPPRIPAPMYSRIMADVRETAAV